LSKVVNNHLIITDHASGLLGFPVEGDFTTVIPEDPYIIFGITASESSIITPVPTA
jgi:hypothetical protein